MRKEIQIDGFAAYMTWTTFSSFIGYGCLMVGRKSAECNVAK